jgi:hypothetical protein
VDVLPRARESSGKRRTRLFHRSRNQQRPGAQPPATVAHACMYAR